MSIFMNWIELAIKTTGEGIDAVTEILNNVGINGVIIEDPRDIEQFKANKADWLYVDENLGYSDEAVVIKGYLPDNDVLYEYVQTIRNRLEWLTKQDLGIDIGIAELKLSNVREEDWANNWKKYFKPKKIGKHLVVKPSWEEYNPSEGEVILELDPGMAFGTGTHETTILCVRALEDWITPDKTLLDVGTGTGILAITGILLGAKSTLAIDLDLDAVRIANENASRNKVTEKIDVVHGDLMDKVQGKFEVVVVNIIADVIIEITKGIREYLTDDGIFIASGIILDRIDDVEKAIKRAGLTIIEIKTMGEWAVVVSRNE
ncbi:MAG: 50S ribosomal protein L11 methyltransferase [Clostridiales bacterium]|nr:50S ribosomal protein L11 methyltransferase [Clostridiales bacterium]